MAETLKVGLELVDGQFKSLMEQDKAAVSQFQNETKKSDEEIRKFVLSLNKAGQSTSNYKGQLKQIQKELTDLTLNYRLLSDAEKASAQGQEMAAKINELTQKAASFKDTIGDVANAIKNASSDTLYWDGLSQGISVAKDSLTAFLGATGLADTESKKFKETLAKIVQVETSLKAVQTVINALQKDSAMMQALTAAKMAITNGLMKVLVVQTSALAVANGTATVAQRALNAAINACPYVAIASAILAVGTALYSFVSGVDDAEEKQEDLNDKLLEGVKYNKALKDAKSAARSETSKNITTIKTLSNIVHDSNQKYEDRLKALNMLKKIVPDYHGSLTKEGLLINDNVGALDKYIQKLIKVAAAQKMIDKAADITNKVGDATDDYYDYGAQINSKLKEIKALEEKVKAAEKARDEQNKKVDNSLPSGMDSKDAGVAMRGANGMGQTAVDKEVKALNKLKDELKSLQQKQQQAKAVINEGEATLKKIQERIEKDAESLLAAVESQIKGDTKTTKNDNPDTTFAKALKKYEETLLLLAKKKEDGLADEETYMAAVYKAAEQYYETINGLKVSTKKQAELTEQITRAKDDYTKGKKTYDDYVASLKELIKAQEEERKAHEKLIQAAEDAIKTYNDFKAGKPDGSLNRTNTAKEQHLSSNVKSRFDIGKTQLEIEDDDALTELDVLLDKIDALKSLSKTILGTQTYDQWKTMANAGESAANDIVKAYDDVQNQISKTIDEAEKLNATIANKEATRQLKQMRKELNNGVYECIKSSTTAVFSFVDGIKDLNKNWDDMSEWEKFKGVFTQVFSGVDLILGIVEAVQTITNLVKLFSAALNASLVATTMATAAQTAQATEQIAMAPGIVAANTAMAASYKILTSAENTAAYASIPFVGMITAPIAQGIYTGLWSSAAAMAAFAEGGIFKGATGVNDLNIARVNSGEMILNGTLLARLFRLLNSSSTGSADTFTAGNVEFKIKGTQLIGVLNNFQKKKNKIL